MGDIEAEVYKYMEIVNILASNIVNSFGVEPIASVELDWIGRIISWIFELFSGYGSVAIGVLVFTLCLKTLVLPLDIYSRAKSKKQSLLMKSMRPQMEKLQQQYANDKNMYSQKVMELQKANGYNPLGACLPMVVSLIIFMVIFSSFSTYSNYATLRNYNEMVSAYNSSVEIYVQTDDNDTDNSHFLIGSDNNYAVDFDKFTAHYKPVYDEAHASDVDENGNPAPKTFNVEEFNALDENSRWEIVINYVKLNAREAASKWYNENKANTELGWIGNLWYPDSMLNKKVPNYSDFSQSVTRAMGAGVSATYEEDYNEVTFNLDSEKNTYNGYFVLIVLAIGLMFLQQFVMMRSQKDANELSSLDGSAAKTNKYMMIIMPIMFGVFSFFYSAAFSIYMITNTLYGLISTLIINKITTVRFEKKGINEKKSMGRPSNNAKRLK